MNRDIEAIKNLISWLIQDPNPLIATPSGEMSNSESGLDKSGQAGPDTNGLDSLSADEISEMLSQFSVVSSHSSNSQSVEDDLSFELGDIPAVQDRFYALLKRRLHTEIERKPPLFPWESEICDYEADYSDYAVPELVPSNFWSAQLKNLSLPVPMPEALLTRLFSRCQDVVHSSLKQGAKLVQVVEPLFPGQSQTLHQLAGLVIASNQVRSASAPALQLPQSPDAEFPAHYDAANPIQQMALSLVAAHQIIDSLSLMVTPDRPTTQQQWLTQAGPLQIEVEYQPHLKPRLRIQSQLPCRGTVQVQNSAAQLIAQRATSGCVGLELFDIEVNQLYPLTIQLDEGEQPAMTFIVGISAPVDR